MVCDRYSLLVQQCPSSRTGDHTTQISRAVCSLKRRLTLLEKLLLPRADRRNFEVENIKQGKKVYNYLYFFF